MEKDHGAVRGHTGHTVSLTSKLARPGQVGLHVLGADWMGSIAVVAVVVTSTSNELSTKHCI